MNTLSKEKHLKEKIVLGFIQLKSGKYTNENIMDIFQQVIKKLNNNTNN